MSIYMWHILFVHNCTRCSLKILIFYPSTYTNAQPQIFLVALHFPNDLSQELNSKVCEDLSFTDISYKNRGNTCETHWRDFHMCWKEKRERTRIVKQRSHSLIVVFTNFLADNMAHVHKFHTHWGADSQTQAQTHTSLFLSRIKGSDSNQN